MMIPPSVHPLTMLGHDLHALELQHTQDTAALELAAGMIDAMRQALDLSEARVKALELEQTALILSFRRATR